MEVKPAREIDYREAEQVLAMHLKAQGHTVLKTNQWYRWYYTTVPFWSVCTVIDTPGGWQYVGYHIHDDGEIIEFKSDIRKAVIE